MSDLTGSNPSTIAILHLLNKTRDHPRFSECLAALKNDDYLLLMENAVVALGDSHCRLPANTGYLIADAQARGLGGDVGASGPDPVDYADMVRLTDRFRRVISW